MNPIIWSIPMDTLNQSMGHHHIPNPVGADNERRHC
jgi:hypothetical protein